jgi:hypothetical protein
MRKVRNSSPPIQPAPDSSRSEPGVFAAQALRLHDAGLVPLPCGGSTNKKPKTKWKDWPADPGRHFVEPMVLGWLGTSPGIGILTGRGRWPVVVVDIDVPASAAEVEAILGATPLVISTPSGGTHLYYRFSGERCRNLRKAPLGRPIDVKAAGGMVIVPPTMKPGTAAGYGFARGSWADLPHLPPIPEGALDRLGGTSPGAAQRPKAQRPLKPGVSCRSDMSASDGRIAPGARNDALFTFLRHEASRTGTVDDLRNAAAEFCRTKLSVPLPEGEVERTLLSVWAYRQEGRLWTGRGCFQLYNDDLDRLPDPQALWLLAHLDRAHGARDGTFAICVQAMAEKKSIPGMGAHSLRKATSALVRGGFLKLVRQGGRGPGDASQYRLARGRGWPSQEVG